MKEIHLSVAFRNGNERVVKWWLLGIYAPIPGLLIGGVCEFIRYRFYEIWTLNSFLAESGLMAAGIAGFLIADGLLRPLEGLPDLNDDAKTAGKNDDGGEKS